jgi:hypothetical protein
MGSAKAITAITAYMLSATCPYRKSDSCVTVMQAAQHGLGDYSTKLLDRPADRAA